MFDIIAHHAVLVKLEIPLLPILPEEGKFVLVPTEQLDAKRRRSRSTGQVD